MRKVVVELDEYEYDFLKCVAIILGINISDVIKQVISRLIKVANRKEQE